MNLLKFVLRANRRCWKLLEKRKGGVWRCWREEYSEPTPLKKESLAHMEEKAIEAASQRAWVWLSRQAFTTAIANRETVHTASHTHG